MPGPLPKRSTERRRRNASSRADQVVMQGKVRAPRLPGDMEVHPIARRWFMSLRRSGQSQYFEPSDWEAAIFVVEAMTRLLKGRRFSAQAFQAVWSAMSELLTTEGARRRARIEVERDLGEDEELPEDIAAIEDYRRELGVS